MAEPNDVAHPPSLFWMREVQRRAEALGNLKAKFLKGEATEYDLAVMQGRLDYAIQQYTDPMRRKRGQGLS